MNDENDPYPFDPELPIEETPGYLGIIWDGEVAFGPELILLSEFDWSEYSNMASEIYQLERCITLNLNGTEISIIADASQINTFLDELPSINAIYDCPPDQGPAGGSGYVFLLCDNWKSYAPLSEQISALREALETDYEILRLEFIRDPEIQKYYEQNGLDLPGMRPSIKPTQSGGT
jgi:hypothetical protein